MNNLILRTLAIWTLWSSALFSCLAQSSPPDELEGIKESIQKLVATGKVPSISIAVARDNSILWSESFGYADIENKVPATPSTIYPVASLSKSISATAIMTLVEAGKVNLDDAVNKLIHPIRLESDQWDTDEIKLWHILNMSSGISHGWTTEKISLQDEEDPAAHLDHLQIAFPPGVVNHYSNFSLGLVKQIIEGVTGSTLEEYLSEAVFQPLGMTQSLGRYDGSRSAEMATIYSSKMKKLEPYDFFPLAGGGYFSSTSDLLKYGMSFLKNGSTSVLEQKTIETMHNFQDGPEGIFELGWGRLGDFLITNGSISGAASTLVLIPSENLVVVCLTNHTSHNSITDQLAFEVAMSMAPNAQGMNLMGEYEQKFRIPYSFNHKLAGEWAGRINTIRGDLAINIKFAENEAISITLGNQRSRALESAIFNKVNMLEGSFKGIIPVSGYDSTEEVNINLNLYLSGNKLYGYLAPAFSSDKGSYSHPFIIELTKKP